MMPADVARDDRIAMTYILVFVLEQNVRFTLSLCKFRSTSKNKLQLNRCLVKYPIKQKNHILETRPHTLVVETPQNKFEKIMNNVWSLKALYVLVIWYPGKAPLSLNAESTRLQRQYFYS